MVRLLQHDQYVGVENDEQAARRDQLGDVAEAVVDRLDTSSPDLATLVGGLRRAAAGRHVLLWSDQRGLQRAWEEIGVGGEPPPTTCWWGCSTRAATSSTSSSTSRPSSSPVRVGTVDS